MRRSKSSREGPTVDRGPAKGGVNTCDVHALSWWLSASRQPEELLLLALLLPEPLHGNAAGSGCCQGEGEGRWTPSCDLNCFNQDPMWTPTKERGRNHRLLFCCGGSHRGWEQAPPAGLLFICSETILSQVTVKAASCFYLSYSAPSRNPCNCLQHKICFYFH